MSKFTPKFKFFCPDCDENKVHAIGGGYYKCSDCGKRNEDDLVVIYSANKLQHLLEIQTKRVENLKKSNEFYADPETYFETSEDEWLQIWNDHEMIDNDQLELLGLYAGKLARSCQAIDQELEKELEGVK